MPRYIPDEEEMRALVSYAAEHGRKWKEALWIDWYNARIPDGPGFPGRGSILHGLRNHPGFGPEGLHTFRLSKPKED